MKRFESLCNEYRENKRLIEELQAMNDSIKSDILAIMGNNEIHVEGAAKATNKTVALNRFDSSRFKKEYPDLFTEYSRETSYKRFCVL
jgi:predicted phage-related endonuclease